MADLRNIFTDMEKLKEKMKTEGCTINAIFRFGNIYGKSVCLKLVFISSSSCYILLTESYQLSNIHVGTQK